MLHLPVRRFDRFLEKHRLDDRTELPVGADNDPYATGHHGPANAGDICRTLCSYLADADGERLVSNAWVADIDIGVARGGILTG